MFHSKKTPAFSIVKTILGGLGFLIAAAVLIFVFVWTKTGAAIGEVEEFFALLGEGKVTQAYEGTHDEFKSSLSEEDFKLLVEQNPGITEVSNLNFNSRSVNYNNEGGTAKLTGTLTLESGEQGQLSVDLVKEGDDWEIVFIDFY